MVRSYAPIPLAELRWELQLSRIPPRKALPMYWKMMKTWILQKLIPNPDPRSRILPLAVWASCSLKNPSYVPVISGYIEGIFFCHLTIWVSAIKRNYQEDIA